MKKYIFILAASCLTLFAQGNDTVKPWTFWYWMYGAVSKTGIQADLQAMKDVGLGGCYLMPIRGTQERPEYQGHAQQLTPAFWEMIDYALQQADSLGLEIGIHICDGFALAGGPWIKPEESMQKVIWGDTLVVSNGKTAIRAIPFVQGYQGYFKEIDTYAVKVEKPLPKPHLSGTILPDEKGIIRSKEAGYIQFDYEKAQTVRSLEIIPSGNNLQAQRLLVQASNDGVHFENVRQLVPPRQGWQNTDSYYTYSIPETTAKHFRFYWTPEGTEPGAEDLDAGKWSPVLKIKEIRPSANPCIDQYEAKSGAVWRIAVDTPADVLHPQTIPFIAGETILPKGYWRIIRFAHTATGHTNATAGGGKGLECDKFSVAAVNKQIDHWFGAFMKRPNARAIKYLHVDSWECGSQNWSENFAEEFKQRRGYDLLPYLPLYAGIPMENGEQVLRDVRTTINDLINDIFFATAKQRAEQYGVQLSSESVAPTMVSDGIEHYKYVDIPMGEFWLNSPTHDKPNDMLDAISGAHVYGKNIIQAEGFTELRGVWDETPAMIKPLLDRNFALGMNRLFFHVNTHNPWINRKPGMTLDGIGLFFQRDQTWFAEAKGLVDYITRCQTLLQTGRPVVDIAVFTGEEMPSRSLTPDRIVPMLPGMFGAERVAAEQARLANQGQPMVESPVGVRHSAGIIDLKDWINPLHGYQYDSMNKDALLHQPFNYKALVVPTWMQVSPTTKARIDELRRQGVQIIDQPYHQTDLETVGRDAILPEGVAYAHRKTADSDIYFLANQQDKTVTFQPVFRAQQEQATCYDPVSHEVTPYDNGTLTLPPFGSIFVIYGKKCIHGVYNLYTRRIQPVFTAYTNREPYTLSFRESGITLEDQQLFDWSRHEDDRIRYFSGHARYTTTLKSKYSRRSKKRTWIVFPKVKDIAHVWVNGIDCGIAWTAPYEVEITKALKKGKNKIEIEVVNTWHNALQGLDEGKAPYEGIWTNAKYRTSNKELLPAGLLEQPELKIEQ